MTIPIPVWKTPTFQEFLAANPHLLNHSSRLVVDPEVPVAVKPPVVPTP
jgi:hypothetical protein